MARSIGMAAAAMASAGLLFVAQAAMAEEGGSVRLSHSLVADYTSMDHAGATVTAGSTTGASTVLQSSGAPFVEGSTYLARCLAYSTVSAARVDIRGACTMTDASGDSLFALATRTAGDLQAGTGGAGRWELVGGSGKYAGIGGGCAYDVEYIPGDRLVSTMDCTWER